MTDCRHIENRFLVIYQRFIVRLMRNLVWGSIITFRHRSRNQNTKFRKFKMSDGRHFENGFIAISQLRIIHFLWDLVCWRRYLVVVSLAVCAHVRGPRIWGTLVTHAPSHWDRGVGDHLETHTSTVTGTVLVYFNYI